MILHNIPKHKNCTNCGICCGPIIVSNNELKMIKQYVSDHPEIVKKIKRNPFTCVFRDEKQKKCMIYPARPVVCQLFGVCKGLYCENGNSAEIDGKKYMDSDGFNLLNNVDWESVVNKGSE